MKKLTKKSLDELAKTMSVIDKSEQNSYWGMYSDDCFWRCVGYMETGLTNITESMAESYALSYFANSLGGYSGTDSYIDSRGAGMSLAEIQKYLEYAKTSGVYTASSKGQYIAYFKTNDVRDYRDTSNMSSSKANAHAVVVLDENPDGSIHIFDPQLEEFRTISSIEAGAFSRIAY